MSKKERVDEYTIIIPRENAEKLYALADSAGYIDDCKYLEDILNRVIEQRWEQMELLK